MVYLQNGLFKKKLLCGKVLAAVMATGVVSMRKCQKHPLCSIEARPARAEPSSDGGIRRG